MEVCNAQTNKYHAIAYILNGRLILETSLLHFTAESSTVVRTPLSQNLQLKINHNDEFFERISSI